MSVKIKVSYTSEMELQGILTLLRPVTKKYKTSSNQEGDHKNAYIEIKESCANVCSAV
jgi:hypothetical protein